MYNTYDHTILDMIFTQNIERAIRTAAVLHDGQKRKGENNPPVIIHPFSVAFIISEYTNDENTIIAGLLHDTIEDTDYSYEELEKEFGTEVREITFGVSEIQKKDGKWVEWRERKEGYIETLSNAPEKSLIVSSADKIHNLSSMIREREKEGEKMWEVFIPGRDAQLWFYGEVLKVVKNRLKNEIVQKFEEVYAEAKKIF